MVKFAAFLLLSASMRLCAADPSAWINSLGGRVERNAQGDIVAVILRAAPLSTMSR